MGTRSSRKTWGQEDEGELQVYAKIAETTLDCIWKAQEQDDQAACRSA